MKQESQVQVNRPLKEDEEKDGLKLLVSGRDHIVIYSISQESLVYRKTT